MPWIEGIGDEVTIFFSIVFLLTILLAAWFSTGIRDIPFISVIIVQLTRRRRANQEQNQSPNSEQAPADLEGNEEDNRTVTQEYENEIHVDHDEVVEEEVDVIGTASHVNPSVSQGSDIVRDNETEQTTGTDGSPDNAEPMDIPENPTCEELRKRRLHFLGGKAHDSAIHNQVVKEQTLGASASQTEAIRRTSSQVKQSETASNSSTDSPISNAATKYFPCDGADVTESVEGAIQVKIKFLNDTHRQVEANLNETIGNFRRRNFSEEISESKLVRFIYNGQDLRNDASTLQSYNIGNNSVLHCLITQPQQEERPNAGNNEDNGLDIGVLMFPLFGLLLGIVWYLRFTYRQIFNVTSTLTLGGITFLYVAAFLSSFRAHRAHEHVE